MIKILNTMENNNSRRLAKQTYEQMCYALGHFATAEKCGFSEACDKLDYIIDSVVYRVLDNLDMKFNDENFDLIFKGLENNIKLEELIGCPEIELD